MLAETKISGIHHITAMSSSASENLSFYENILGLRLVKQTVNFDDPNTYHLYYGDYQGNPGTILTFFPWENLPPGKPGAGMVTAIAFAVPRASMAFWTQRISAAARPLDKGERFGEPLIRFTDPHGLPLELIGVTAPPAGTTWERSPIPRVHAISGFHSATATLQELGPVEELLVDVLGMTLQGQEDRRYRFKTSDPATPGHYYDVVIDAQAPSGRSGGGTVHHIAFRTASEHTELAWQSLLRQKGFAVTEVRDRNYFRSIYFSSPGGVLVEIATDPPGFGVDEPPDTLGSALKLPPQYEPMRAEIEKRLPPLRPDAIPHVYREAAGPVDDQRTMVTLHGTGGSEHDLVDLAASVSATSAILSPRGQVSENGMPRFFRRLANNVFDEHDVIRRAHELSNFLRTETARYGRDPHQMTALGYSNGANMAAAILLMRPEVFSSAVLMRPMLPLGNPSLPDLKGKQILVLRGSQDTVIPGASTDQLVEVLEAAGATVTVQTMDAGHEITRRDIEVANRWLADLSTIADQPVAMAR